MKQKSPLAPRNPLVAEARFKKAGSHEKSGKARRRADKMALRSEIRAEKKGGFFGLESPTKCRGNTTLARVFQTRQCFSSHNNKENPMQQEIIREFLEQSRVYFGLEQGEPEPESRSGRHGPWWLGMKRPGTLHCCLH